MFSGRVAIERACLDAVKAEHLIPVGIPQGFELKSSGHLFERLHGKNPFIQLHELETLNLGTPGYQLEHVD